MAHLVVPAAIGLSAALLFQVQPLVAKWYLPWFGGGASIWTACMLFFQTMLVGGYLYSHLLVSRLRPRTQRNLHLALLSLAAAGLATAALFWPSPLTPGPGWKPAPSSAPLPHLLGLLALSAGLPYLALAATGPLLQRWFVRLAPGRPPYRLYAVSNAGSLVGLLSYPLVVEPNLRTPVQAWIWTALFGLFTLLVAAVAVSQARVAEPDPASEEPAAPDAPAPAASEVSTWMALAGTASLGLLAVTNQLTLDIASIPFLWVAPLVLYLSTFIACFSGHGRYRRPLWGALLVASSASTVLLLERWTTASLPVQIGTLLVLLLALSMVCHGELAARVPHPSRLTAFYLAIAAGGALGGLAAAVLAPALFAGLWELPIAIYLAVFLLFLLVFRDRPAALFSTPSRRAASFLATSGTLVTLGLLLGWTTFGDQASVVVSRRNFYGWFVVNRMPLVGRMAGSALQISHGRIVHGEQVEVPASLSRYPTDYYGPTSGVSLAIRAAKEAGGSPRPIRVGVVGLGAGTLAAWCLPGDVYRFYEINGAITRLSSGPAPLFTYLSGAGGRTEVVEGDARLQMEAEPGQAYDVLVLDAFSSDAIPVHLLTREAFDVYRRHLAGSSSMIAVHASNLHLDLEPTVKVLARAAGLYGMGVRGGRGSLERPSYWLLLAASREALEVPVLAAVATPWKPSPGGPRLWTDDYSNVLGALRIARRR